MKKLALILSLSLLLTACGDFQWLPDPATFTLTLTPSKFTNLCAVTISDTNIQSPESITVTGISAPAAISVSGGEYSINSGTYTSTAGTINTGQSVRVRPPNGKITSDTEPVIVTLTIATTSVTFTVTPGPCGTTTTQDFSHL